MGSHRDTVGFAAGLSAGVRNSMVISRCRRTPHWIIGSTAVRAICLLFITAFLAIGNPNISSIHADVHKTSVEQSAGMNGDHGSQHNEMPIQHMSHGECPNLCEGFTGFFRSANRNKELKLSRFLLAWTANIPTDRAERPRPQPPKSAI